MRTAQQRPNASLQKQMTAWRRDFHRHPEIGFAVKRTASVVEKILRQCGAKTKRIADVGVVGILRRGSGKRAVGLRAELDALPIAEAGGFRHRSAIAGKMHACGHDGHSAMLLGAACRLAKIGKFDGAAVFIFQPDEENGFGAKAMIDDGLFRHFPVDRVFGMHNLPSLAAGKFAMRAGPIMACEDHFRIVVEGGGGHAAQPHLCADSLVAGAEIVGALQTVVSRVVNPALGGVVSVTNFQTDGAQNVIPSRVELRGDARSYDTKSRRDIRDSLERIARGICEAHRVSLAEFEYEHRFEMTANSDAETQSAFAAACEITGKNNVDGDCPRMMFSEDFGRMLNEKPGCFIFIGNGEESAPLHSPRFDFNDAILADGANYWTRLVERELPPQ